MTYPRDQNQWRADYRATTEALELIRAQELLAMTDERVWQCIQSLCACTTPWRERDDWSGLVEQQDLFHRRSRR
jgi:hypothetical protein